MSWVYAWINPNFWNQLKFFSPHRVNGKLHFIKRDFCLPYNREPIIERRALHLKYDPPASGRYLQFIWTSGMFRRINQRMWDHASNMMKKRGNCFSDYVGTSRRKIRYAIYEKNRDPYIWHLQASRNIRMRYWRTFGWQVPESHGPGPGLGLVPPHLDYTNKITRMIEDDWTDTGLSCYAMKMIPTITQRKYYNELPRMTAYCYGMDYTKEQMFNHITWGIDPGNEKIDKILNPTDPAMKEFRDYEREMRQYLYPDVAPAWEPDYKLRWPFPDDNVYRPTYNRGFNRRYWSRWIF